MACALACIEKTINTKEAATTTFAKLAANIVAIRFLVMESSSIITSTCLITGTHSGPAAMKRDITQATYVFEDTGRA